MCRVGVFFKAFDGKILEADETNGKVEEPTAPSRHHRGTSNELGEIKTRIRSIVN